MDDTRTDAQKAGLSADQRDAKFDKNAGDTRDPQTGDILNADGTRKSPYGKPAHEDPAKQAEPIHKALDGVEPVAAGELADRLGARPVDLARTRKGGEIDDRLIEPQDGERELHALSEHAATQKYHGGDAAAARLAVGSKSDAGYGTDLAKHGAVKGVKGREGMSQDEIDANVAKREEARYGRR